MGLAYKGKLMSGDECEEELKILLKESNPLDSGDWRLDPVLQRACQVLYLKILKKIVITK